MPRKGRVELLARLSGVRADSEKAFRIQGGGEDRDGYADYLLYPEGHAIGVIEAKPVGHTLEGVIIQAKRYTEGLDERVSAWRRPLPFAYESTGEVTQFTNGLDSDPCSREIFFRRQQASSLDGLTRRNRSQLSRGITTL